MPQEQNETTFEVMADEVIKTANSAQAAQTASVKQAVDNITAQLLQGGVAALNVLMMKSVETLDLAAKRSLDHWDNVKVLADTATGAAADAMIDQSPPDEGVRQAKTE